MAELGIDVDGRSSEIPFSVHDIGLERRDLFKLVLSGETFFSSDMFIYFRVAAYVYVLLIFVGRQKKRASRPAGQIFNDFS